MTWLWYLLLLLLLLLAYGMYRMFFARAAGVIPTVGISVVGLDITPTELPCDGKSKFTAVVTASGWSDDGVSHNVQIKLIDDEWSPDELDKDPKGTATIGIKFPSPLPGSAPYTWTLSHTMTGLYCDTDCYVKGPSGSSGESDPSVYAEVSVIHGNPWPVAKSKGQTIKCVQG